MIHLIFWRCQSHWHYPSEKISQMVFIIFNNFVFEGSTGSSIVRHQLSVRAEQLANLKFLKTAVMSNIPKQPLPTPSKILMLGRSIALPRPQHNGTVLQFALNPSSPISDQDQFSPNNIHTLSTDKLWELLKWSPK